MKQLLLAISLIAALMKVGGKPEAVETDGAYTKYALTDSATLEVYEADTICVVMTVCAPQCSSCARIYNKEGELIYNNVETNKVSRCFLVIMGSLGSQFLGKKLSAQGE